MKTIMSTKLAVLASSLALVAVACSHRDPYESERLSTNSEQVDGDRVSLFEGNDIGDSYDSNRVGGARAMKGDTTLDSTRMTGASREEQRIAPRSRHTVKSTVKHRAHPDFVTKRKNLTGASAEPASDRISVKDISGGADKALTSSAAIEKKKAFPGDQRWRRTTGASREKTGKHHGVSGMLMTEKNSELTKLITLNRLYHVNQKEIAMAEMAKKKSTNGAVSLMADRILADHRALDEKVKATASAERIKLHDYQPATHEAAVLDRLNGLEGREFDQAFFQVMKQGHEAAIADVKKDQTLNRDPEVGALLRSALPSFREHERASVSGASRVR